MSLFLTIIFILTSFSCRMAYSDAVTITMPIPANYVGCEAWLVKQNISDYYIPSVNDSITFTGFAASEVKNNNVYSSAVKNAGNEVVRIDVQGHSADFLSRVDPDLGRENTPRVNKSVLASETKSTSQTFLIPDVRSSTIPLQSVDCDLLTSDDICNIYIDNRIGDTECGIFPFYSYPAVDHNILKKNADELKSTFVNKIYPKVTTLMGSGSVSDIAFFSDSRRERMKDSKINIIITDINRTQSATQGTVGFFYNGDFFKVDSNKGNPWGNKLLCFYIDYTFWRRNTALVTTTLAHEFTHMLNYGQKNVKYGNRSPSTWWTELLAMVMEDVLSKELFGESISHSPQYLRFGSYLDANDDLHVPFGEFYSSNAEVMLSYGTCYMMGAFLARNFGGAALIHDVATNYAPGSYESWDVALAKCSSNLTEHSTLSGALSEFPIALIASSCEEAEGIQDRPHKYSFFNKSDKRSSSIGSEEYIFEPFPKFQKPAKRFSDLLSDLRA